MMIANRMVSRMRGSQTALRAFSSSLQDKVILVTGASSGIGKATAIKLANEGARVFLVARKEEKLQAVADLISSSHGPGSAITHKLDVSDTNGIREMFKRIDGELGQLDGAFNNAALALPGSILDFRENSMENLLKLNITSTSVLIQEELKLLIKYGNGGNIVNTSAFYGIGAVPHAMAYAMTKSALYSITQTAAVTVAAKGISVNTISPGYTEATGMLDGSIKAAMSGFRKSEKEVKDSFLSHVPTRRFVQVDEIAHLVAFLMNPLARSITGQNIVIDGGASIVSHTPFDALKPPSP